MKRRTQILIALLVLGKIVFAVLYVHAVGMDALFLRSDAVASELKEDRTPEDIQGGEKASELEKIDENILIMRKAEIEREQKKLLQRKKELLNIQQDLDQKIAMLTQLRDEIRNEVVRQRTFEEQKLKHLIKAYSSMKPQSAAGLIEKLDLSMAIELLSNMKGDDVGNILSYLDLERAAKISEGLLKYE